MKKRTLKTAFSILLLTLCAALLLSCGRESGRPGGVTPGGALAKNETLLIPDSAGDETDSGASPPAAQTNEKTPTGSEDTPEPTVTDGQSDGLPSFTPGEPAGSGSFSSNYEGADHILNVVSSGGSFSAAQSEGILYLELTEKTTLTLSGTYAGGVMIRGNAEKNVDVVLDGCTLIAQNACPALYFVSAKNAGISANGDTENYINDERAAAEELKSAVYAACDLKLKGTGFLTVSSKNNNGIHTKDDLTVKELTLSVNCVDNALKGSDGVTVESGTLTLIARQGDGIKTSNTALSSSGRQKGSVVISGGSLKIYAACDGIDAACDVTVENDPGIEICTDKYSEYSEAVTKTSASFIYIRASDRSYKYSILFTLSDGKTVWANSSGYEEERVRGYGKGGGSVYYYYKIEKPADAVKMNVFIYTASQAQGQSEKYYVSSGEASINENFDTVYYNGSSFRLTNRGQSGGPGPGHGPGPGGEGNRDKGTYSTKGIKAGNAVSIGGGTVTVKAYDDAIHANNETALESGVTPAGDVTVTGGKITLSSNDDGVHADGRLNVTGGELTVLTAYEGIEANVIGISGGRTVLTASDDGVNVCSGKSTPAINITGGYLDVTVSPNGDTDGIDSNGGYTQTGGVVITRGPNSQMMAALDSENGARISGGTLIILGYGRVTASGGVKTLSLSLHAKGSHTVTVGGTAYTFTNAYAYGKTYVYSDAEIKA